VSGNAKLKARPASGVLRPNAAAWRAIDALHIANRLPSQFFRLCKALERPKELSA